MEELSRVKKKTLESDIRNYLKLKNDAVIALVDSSSHKEDINSWIKGSRLHSEQALNLIIKRENNLVFNNKMHKYNAVLAMYERLPTELQEIVSVYMWGEYNYLSWPEVAEHIPCAKRTIYKWRDKIIHTYAEELGEISKSVH